MPLQSTSGAASYDAFGGGTVAKVNYIEDFFQSYLRTGTGASATVTTGLDGSTKETLVWTKSRSAATNHKLTDNVRGATKALSSNTTSAEATDSQGLTAFSATGYTLGTNTDYNNSGATYVDWQWVSQPKFFDVVTYTGNGVAGRTIAHNLGSVPGCIILKSSSEAGVNWNVFHRSIAPTGTLRLNLTDAQTTNFIEYLFGNDTAYVAPTSSVFTVGGSSAGNQVNGSGATYVAYLFAHDAGGFGLTGTDNVISCGSLTSTSGVVTVNLGYEPQWLMMKNTTSADSWYMYDTMRGMSLTNDVFLQANNANAEGSFGASYVKPTATGFTWNSTAFGGAGETYIYIAIRRGPMKVPTDATKVYTMALTTASAPNNTNSVTSGFPVDLWITRTQPSPFADPSLWMPRLTTLSLDSSSTGSESANPFTNRKFDSNTGIANRTGSTGGTDLYPNWMLQRAPSFFDAVCWTGDGTGSSLNVSHNLGTIPLLLITKKRSTTSNWVTNPWNGSSWMDLKLNTTAANTGNVGGIATSTTFNPSSILDNASGVTYVTYLFATCAGVSKVGSYTGNGTTQTIDCGFTGGARFVLLKRTDSTGGWYTYDTTRGMTVLTDPYLFTNTSAGQVATLGSVTTVSTGFALNSAILADINVSAGTYIFLAIA